MEIKFKGIVPTNKIETVTPWNFYLIQHRDTLEYLLIFIPHTGDILCFGETYNISDIKRQLLDRDYKLISKVTDKIVMTFSF